MMSFIWLRKKGRINRPCRNNLKRACPLPHGSISFFFAARLAELQLCGRMQASVIIIEP
jgi:hypothetical protein